MAKYVNLGDPDVTYSHNVGNHEVYIVGSEAERIDIVRCGECKNFTEYRHGNGWCALHETDLICRDDFCSKGERRADDD